MQDPDVNKVVNEVIFGPGSKRYRYCKHIAKQRVSTLPKELMKKGKHFILIRNPLYILPSLGKVVPPSFFELGLADLVSIYTELCELGRSPPIIDAEDLQQDPEIKKAIFTTLIVNGMFDNAHVRLTLTRGKKVTSGMSPAFNLYGCTLIVLAEWKPSVYDNSHGICLVTASTHRNSPNNLDSKIHHNNLISNILAKIEGNLAQAEDAIMLDKDGFVSETNATNIFLVKKKRVSAPRADYCLPGITRATVMDLVLQENFILQKRRISLSEFHTTDEVWTTGTMGELTPVVKIDGRVIGNGEVGSVTRTLQNAYRKTDVRIGRSYTHASWRVNCEVKHPSVRTQNSELRTQK